MPQNIGPVQLLAVGFDPDARFEGRIMDELANLERHETIRILDLLFVGKDAETGDLLALDYQGEELGAIVGAMLGAFRSGRVSLRPRPSLPSLPSSSPCQRPSRNSRARRRAPGRRENQGSRTNEEEGEHGWDFSRNEAHSGGGAADLPDHGAHAAAPLVRPEQGR